MKIGETHSSCRYWGYEVDRPDNLSLGSPEERRAARDKHQANRAIIKAAGFQPSRYGMRAKIAAIGQASKIERETGVQMHVFNHDYL